MSKPLNVFITAGASGIGLAMARGFVARGGGGGAYPAGHRRQG